MKTLTLPWSKSLTNRDLVLASLSNWITELKWYLRSEDTKYMIDALNTIWIKIYEKDESLFINWWVDNILWNNKELYIHQSWTCMRFLTWLAILNKKWNITITWDERLLERPMWDLIDGIRQLWIKIESNWNLPPVTITPSKINNNIIKIKWTSSSQFFTALLLIWALIPKWLEINVIWNMVSKPYIDLTIEELRKFWIKVINNQYKSFKINQQKITSPNILQVEWDASALSYIANYVIFNNNKITITNLWDNSKQWDYKYLKILKKYFWFDFLSWWNDTILDWNITISLLEEYREVDFEDMPDISMSFMSIAPLLKWKTKIIWLQTLNLKECKRIDAMWEELSKLWVKLNYDSDSMIIYEWFNPPKNIKIETYNDHRIAMVFWTLKTFLEKKYDTKIEILNPECVWKTYTNFWKDLESLK